MLKMNQIKCNLFHIQISVLMMWITLLLGRNKSNPYIIEFWTFWYGS